MKLADNCWFFVTLISLSFSSLCLLHNLGLKGFKRYMNGVIVFVVYLLNWAFIQSYHSFCSELNIISIYVFPKDSMYWNNFCYYYFNHDMKVVILENEAIFP